MTDHGTPDPGSEATTGLSGRLVVERDRFRLDVSLEVRPGATLAIVGPNGSGKSTLVAAIGGLLPLTAGVLRHDDRVLDDPRRGVFVPPEDRGFALVPQDGLLFPHLSVLANVAFPLRHRRDGSGRRAEHDRQAMAALESVDLAGMAERRPRDLSGGQAQRVAVARALTLQAAVLLLDEPLSNIDVDNRQLIRKLLRTERPSDQIHLVVTHGREHAMDADLILALDAGETLALGRPEELAADPPVRWLAELFARPS